MAADTLGVEDMCQLVAENFDSDVVDTFRCNKIDGSVFLELDEGDMKELGITALGDRKKLKKLMQTLKEKESRREQVNGHGILEGLRL